MLHFTLLLVLLQVLDSAPAATPSPALKTIINVKTSRMCNTLVHSIAPAIQGLQANDGLVSEGRMLMAKMRSDAIVDPGATIAGNGVTNENGGAGASSRMDDVKLSALAHQLAQNILKLDDLLKDEERFPKDPKSVDERNLLLVKASLEAVIAKQRIALDILSETADSNELNDLLSVGSIGIGTEGHAAARLTMPEYLQLAQSQTEETEKTVTPAILPVVASCR